MKESISLVTGGAGFIGRHIVHRLHEEGEAVRVLDPAAADVFPSDIEVVTGSVLDVEALDNALKGVRHVYHLAANAQLWDRDKTVFERLNHHGTRNVLTAARRAGAANIVVTSSATILRGWNDPETSAITEEEPTPPYSAMAGAYDRSKWRADQAARHAAAEGLPVVITYPTAPIGPDDPGLTPPMRMIRGFLEGRTSAYLDCVLNLVAVEDVAAGHILAARHAPPGSRYILAGENLMLGEILAQLEELTGREMPVQTVPYWLAQTAGIVGELIAAYINHRQPAATRTGVRLAKHPHVIDGSKAVAELGLALTPFDEALLRAVRWLQKRRRYNRSRRSR